MRSLAEIAESTRAETKFRASKSGSLAPVFAVQCLAAAVGRRAISVRVRAGGIGGLEERYGREWRLVIPSDGSPEPWTKIVWSLKEMSNIRPGKPAIAGAKLALVLDRGTSQPVRADFDSTYAFTPTGDTIVLTGVRASGESTTRLDRNTATLKQQSNAWLDEAQAAADRSDRDHVRKCLEAAATGAFAIGRGNAALAAPILLRGGTIAHRAGLSEDAITLLQHAIGCGITSARGRVFADLVIAEALEALERFDEALPHHERALAEVEAFGVETGLLAQILSDTARGWARAGNPTRAALMLDRARDIADSLLGPDSAFLSPRLEAARLRRERDPAAARVSLSEVLALAEAYGDEETIESALRETAEVDLTQGFVAEATERLKRALAIARSHPRALPIYTLLARALGAADHHTEALEVLRAGAELARTARRPDHPERVAIESALALAGRAAPYR